MHNVYTVKYNNVHCFNKKERKRQQQNMPEMESEKMDPE